MCLIDKPTFRVRNAEARGWIPLRLHQESIVYLHLRRWPFLAYTLGFPLFSDQISNSGGRVRPHWRLTYNSRKGDLCLSLFPWAKFRKFKGAVKLHTLLDLRGNIPTVVIITPAKIHEVNILDQLTFEAGAFYLMDRAYLDFRRLYRLHLASAFFVTRARKRFAFRRLRSLNVDRTTGIICDQVITLSNPVPRQGYPDRLRRIHYFDTTQNRRLIFLTNNFTLPAITIAELYRSRWQVELFFKWIKQHLRIKKFYGTSENALKTQIWTAISVYVLVAIVKKQLNLDTSLYKILQILSVTIFEKVPILEALSLRNDTIEVLDVAKQLILFD